MTMLFACATSDTLQFRTVCTGVAEAPLHVTLATPERASVTVPVTVTVGINRIAPSGGELMVTTGGVLSTFTATLVMPTFPATSTAVPVTIWFAPSVVITTGGVTLATPERLSVATKDTFTSVWFQPFELASGAWEAVTAGGVISKLMMTVVVAAFPARSVAVPEIR